MENTLLETIKKESVKWVRNCSTKTIQNALENRYFAPKGHFLPKHQCSGAFALTWICLRLEMPRKSSEKNILPNGVFFS